MPEVLLPLACAACGKQATFPLNVLGAFTEKMRCSCGSTDIEVAAIASQASVSPDPTPAPDPAGQPTNGAEGVSQALGDPTGKTLEIAATVLEANPGLDRGEALRLAQATLQAHPEVLG